MNLFERGLTLWVALCMLAGTLLGQWLPDAFAAIGRLELAQVNLPVGALIWLMIVPMLVRVDFSSLGQLRRHWRGFGVTLAVNWLLKPLLMAALAGLFIRHWFAGWLPADQQDSYIAGLILLAAAPCTAMVFVWSRLVGGDANYTLSQVALNDALMLLLFAPLVALLLGVAAVPVPWGTLLLSVALYILLPLALAQVLRQHWLRRGPAELERQLARLGPVSMLALLATLVLLFGFQGQALLAQPLTVLLLAVPITLQVAISSALAYCANRAVGEPHAIAGPSCLIGASNFFELAVATAIALYGLNSGAALATVVGVLVEVPAMLAVVAVVKRSRNWYRRSTVPGN